MINYDLEKIKDVDMNFVRQFLPFNTYKFMTLDIEHYKLLAYFASLYDNTTFYDLGSYKGNSAIALAENLNNQVISYDIGYFLEYARQPINVEFRIGDFYRDKGLLDSPLIMVDVDPHDGKQESLFFNYLETNKYKGMVILDDIHLNKGMEDFWRSVSQRKVDATKYGHYSGTGLVFFD
jgi:hypothetical protein